ncbi:MAG: hypothetical protein WBF33_36680 [Candidatus Nitrosopolaris sp.]
MEHTIKCKSFRTLEILGQFDCDCWCHHEKKNCNEIAATDNQRDSQIISSSSANNMKITDFIK